MTGSLKELTTIVAGIFRSLLPVCRQVLLGKRAEVVFYYPRHFNRTGRGTNPFFDTLIATARESGLSLLVLEGGRYREEHKRNTAALPVDILLFFMYIVQRVILRGRFSRLEERDQYLGSPEAARIINALTFGKFKAPVYVTISNAMVGFFKGMNPDATVVDIQHGIIYPTHSGYFNPDKIMRPSLMESNLHFFVTGEGYRRCFMQTEENRAALANRVHVIGDVAGSGQAEIRPPQQGRAVLFSLQFSPDLKGTQPDSMRQKIFAFVEEFRPLAEKYALTLRFKIRPNSGYPAELAGIEKRYPFVEFNASTMAEACDGVFYHVTFYSTVAFDVARWGIPTYFLTTPDITQGKLFHEVYGYPKEQGSFGAAGEEALSDAAGYRDLQAKVMRWRGDYYAPFNAEKFVGLIKGFVAQGA
jgi:hypothetical protein